MSSNGDVREVEVEGEAVATVFGVPGRGFYFLLKDERDLPRGLDGEVGFDSIADAMHAAANQHRCLQMADAWELMLDT